MDGDKKKEKNLSPTITFFKMILLECLKSLTFLSLSLHFWSFRKIPKKVRKFFHFFLIFAKTCPQIDINDEAKKLNCKAYHPRISFNF